GGAADNTRPPSAQENRGGGWQRFGAPARQSGGAVQPDAGRRSEQNETENTRPKEAAPMERPPQQQQPQQNRGNWQRFGEPGGSARPAAPSPRSDYQGGAQSNPGSRYGQPGGSVVRERPSAPEYSAPRYS